MNREIRNRASKVIGVFIITILAGGYTLMLYRNPLNNVSHLFEYLLFGMLFAVIYPRHLFSELDFFERVYAFMLRIVIYGAAVAGLYFGWWQIGNIGIKANAEPYEPVMGKLFAWGDEYLNDTWWVPIVGCVALAIVFIAIDTIINNKRDLFEQEALSSEEESDLKSRDGIKRIHENVMILGITCRTRNLTMEKMNGIASVFLECGFDDLNFSVMNEDGQNYQR